MSTPPASLSSSISLALPAVFYVAGSTIHREILLDFRHLQVEDIQEVYVKFYGYVSTHIRSVVGQSFNGHRESIPLIHIKAPAWKDSDAHPPMGSDVLRLSFSQS